MKTNRLFRVLCAGLLVFWVVVPRQGWASTPYLSVTRESGNSVRIEVSGADAYVQVDLYARPQNLGYWLIYPNIGTTDGSGRLVRSSNYPSDTTGQVDFYVSVGGLLSSTVNIGSSCNGYNCQGGISFSNSSPQVNVGQTLGLAIYGGSGSYYVSNNSNTSVVSASVSGSQLSLYGSQTGSSTLTICSYSNTCGTLYVNVGGGSSSGLTFSQSNVTLGIGQSQNVTVNGNYNYSLYISSNSNSNSVSASISGNSVNLYGINSGSSVIMVCQQNGQCGSIYVSVGGYGGGTVSFSQNNITLNQGQSVTVNVYSSSYNPFFYISNNESPNIVAANIIGSSLTLFGSSYGSSRVTVCTSGSNQCGSIYVSVSGGGYTNQVTLSQNSLNLNVGQSGTVTVYNANTNNLYVTNNTNPNVASVGVQNYLINVRALSVGNTSATICIYQYLYSNSCATLNVTVSGSNYNYNNSNSAYPYNYGGLTLGVNTLRDGTLIQEGSTIYMVYAGQKSAFGSWQVFRSMGFKSSMVSNVGNSNLPDSGYVVASISASHPWGSWVKSGGTVYFVHMSGLIPVPNESVFLTNGGHWNLVVPINYSDTRKPVLGVMTESDYRVQ